MKSKLSLLLGVIIASFGVTFSTYALPILEVDYGFTNGEIEIYGSFTGEDINEDGWLQYDELTDWNTDYGTGFQYDSLKDLGDVYYPTNTWIANGEDGFGDPTAYMTWDDGGASISVTYGWEVVTAVTFVEHDHAPVPEPATVALLGIGLVGIAGAEARRRRKKKAIDKS